MSIEQLCYHWKKVEYTVYFFCMHFDFVCAKFYVLGNFVLEPSEEQTGVAQSFFV